MTDEEFLGRWFAKVTKPQLAIYNQSMADAAPYRGAPKWDRKRQAASKEFQDSTSEARRLYELAMSEIVAVGEVSEETGELLTNYENLVADDGFFRDLAIIRQCMERV